jgi:chromosome segregation ATPase
MLAGDNNKELFDYWHKQVEVRNYHLIKSAEHVPTPTLRHQCTNYDKLRHRTDVTQLDELQRSRVIAIIKYECTAQVLQRRAGLLKDRAVELNRGRLESLIRALQEKLFGKDQQIQQLEFRVSQLQAEKEALEAERDSSDAKLEMEHELTALQEKLQAAEAKRWELTRRTQSLGGRLAHTTRYQRERDVCREALLAEQARCRALEAELELLRGNTDPAT